MAYAWDGNELHRLFWRVLDRAPNSEPSRQLLLAGVTEVALTALDSAGDEHEAWPPATPPSRMIQLRGWQDCRLRITTDEFDVLRLWTTPQGVDFLDSRSADAPPGDEELDDAPPPDDLRHGLR